MEGYLFLLFFSLFVLYDVKKFKQLLLLNQDNLKTLKFINLAGIECHGMPEAWASQSLHGPAQAEA